MTDREQERLDEETERIISNIVWGDRGSVPALRSRIRQLQEEARKEGARVKAIPGTLPDTAPFIWDEDTTDAD